MDRTVRIIVSDSKLFEELGRTAPAEEISVRAEPPDLGFNETLYPVLVNFGIAALPASVVASLIAAWIVEAWKRCGRLEAVGFGVEAGTKSDAISLTDADVERIAGRLRVLLTPPLEPDDDDR